MIVQNNTELCSCDSGKKYKNCHKRIEHRKRKEEKIRFHSLWTGNTNRLTLGWLVVQGLYRDADNEIIGTGLSGLIAGDPQINFANQLFKKDQPNAIDFVHKWFADRDIKIMDFDLYKGEDYRFVELDWKIFESCRTMIEIPADLALKSLITGIMC